MTVAVTGWPAAERRLRARHFAPPPRLTVSEWADRYRVLSSEASIAGQWQSHPYQREIMDVGADDRYRRVVAMLPSQTTKTEILLNHIGYSVDLDPCPMMMVIATLDLARAMSKDRLEPMFRDTPRLRGQLHESGRREADNTMLFKAGDGWRLTMVGANAAAGLAARPIRKLFLDEPDRYPASAGEEGDPVALAEKRTTRFPNRLVYLTGSPTVAGASRIAKEYAASDQRQWLAPCPHCGHRQPLKWGGPDQPFGLKWDRDADRNPLFETAYYLCAECAGIITERDRQAMNKAGAWVATHPERDIAGFHMTALACEAIPWSLLVREWYDAKGQPHEMQVFVNTRLAEPWEEPGEKITVQDTQRERFGLDAEGYPLVPAGAALLTAGVDVQGDRLEVLATAWGAGEESWQLGNWRIFGDVVKREPWADLERLRTREWTGTDGAKFRIRCLAVDTGAMTQAVCDYIRPLERRGVIATKGASDHKAQILSRPSKPSDKYRVRVWLVGTVAAKDILFYRMRRVHEPGPGYVHFGEAIDTAFLDQLGAERAVTRQGHRSYELIAGRRNEAIDLSVLSLVALYALGEPARRGLGKRPIVAPAAPVEEPSEIVTVPVVSAVKRRAPARKNFATSWR